MTNSISPTTVGSSQKPIDSNVAATFSVHQAQVNPEIGNFAHGEHISHEKPIGTRNLTTLDSPSTSEIANPSVADKLAVIKNIPLGTDPATIASAVDALRTEILNNKENLNSTEFATLQKAMAALTRRCNLHNDKACMPRIEQTCITIDAIASGQTDVTKGEKLGNGTVNSVFLCPVADKELVLKECIHSQITRAQFDENSVPEFSSGLFKIGKDKSYAFLNDDTTVEQFQKIQNLLKKSPKLLSDSGYELEKSGANVMLYNGKDQLVAEKLANGNYRIHNPGERGYYKEIDRNGHVTEVRTRGRYHTYTPGSETYTLNDGANIEVAYHTMMNTPAKYVKTVTKKSLGGETKTIEFPPPNTIKEKVTNTEELGNGMLLSSENINPEQRDVIDKIKDLNSKMSLRDSFRTTFVSQGNISGHLDMYGANKGTTIVEELLGTHTCAQISAALDHDGNAYIAMGKALGKDMFHQTTMFYDKSDYTIKTDNGEGELVSINLKTQVKIMAECSALQALDCITGQMDRHPGNIMSEDGLHFIGIDNDLGFITPERRPELANKVNNVIRDPSKTSNQSLDGNSPRNFCMPPVLDVDTANKILQLDPGKLEGRLKDETTLPESAIKAAKERLEIVKSNIRKMADIGNEVNSIPNDSKSTWESGGTKFIGRIENANRLNSYALQSFLPIRYTRT